MKTNSIGLSKENYQGAPSTLCVGCGHDSVTQHIITALFQEAIPPHRVAKLSGIGCSSKTPTYFLSQAHGFNSIHGRMAPLATGVSAVRPDLKLIGISGDGDTASIGLGGFIHLLRRDVPMLYIIENNGVYGLTKGQFSATADRKSTLKSGEQNPFESVDLCTLAIDVGCRFVARSFSGDSKQMVNLIKAGLHHQGTAVIDVISPCVTFGNHDGSTKSYNFVKEHRVNLNEIGLVLEQAELTIDYAEGECQEIDLGDGTLLRLRKLLSTDHDVTQADRAIQVLRTARKQGEILTGLFYCESNGRDFHKALTIDQHASLGTASNTELTVDWQQITGLFEDYR